MTWRKFFIGVVLTFALVIKAFAFDVPAYEDYVTDLAEVFSVEEELNLENQITEIEKSMTVEIAVLTVPTTGEYDIFDYTHEVATQWGVGKKENDNGLMVVIAVDDMKWFMATGYGLEGILPDGIVKRIGENNFPPNFRAGDYAQGVEDALVDIKGYLEKDPTVIANYNSTSSEYDSIPQDLNMIGVILFTIFLFLIPFKSGFWVRKDKKKRKERSLLSTALIFVLFSILMHLIVGVIMAIYSLIADWADASSSGSGSSGSGWRSGGGWSSGSGWSSGGSSFGGFGGGSFGGGGAGGGW